MDKIIINNVSVFCRIGVTVEERVRAQQLFVTVEFSIDLKPAGIADDVEKTVDYSVACKELKVIGEQEFLTIEGFAEVIAARLTSLFKFDAIKVCVKKPGALAKQGGKFAAVVIER